MRRNMMRLGRQHAAAASLLHLNLDFFAVFVLGASSLTLDAWLPAVAGARWLPMGFGALLTASVVLRFLRALRLAERPLRSRDIHAIARQLSRKVYGVLYAQMLFDVVLGTLRPVVSLQTHLEGFRGYLIYGCVALGTLRVLPSVCKLPLFGIQRNGRLTYREPASPKRQG